MSVGHICNAVLGGVENICPEWVLLVSLAYSRPYRHPVLVSLKFMIIILFHFTLYMVLIWWWCQVCSNPRWQNFVGLRLSMEFALCYISSDRILSCLTYFWKICASMLKVKNSIAHLHSQSLQLLLLAKALLFYLVFLGKFADSIFRVCMISLCQITVSAVQSVHWEIFTYISCLA